MESYSMTMTTLDGRREQLDSPEFIGNGLHTLDDAISAANDAVDYVGGGVWMIDIYRDDEHVGYVQDGKFFAECE